MKRKKLGSALLIWAIIFCTLVTSISTYIVSHIVFLEVNEKMKSAYLSNLQQLIISMENNLENLATFSQSFTPYGSMGQAIVQYYDTDVTAEKALGKMSVEEDMGILLFINHNVTLGAIYEQQNRDDLICVFPLENDFYEHNNQLLLQENQMTYYGPHVSESEFSNNLVISSIRSFNIDSQHEVVIYAETPFDLTEKYLETSLTPDGLNILMLNKENKIIFSDDEKMFPSGMILEGITEEEVGEMEKYVWYQAQAGQGWKFVSVIDKEAIRNLQINLMMNYILVFPLFLLISIIFCILIYRRMTKPLIGFYDGIQQIEKGDFNTIIPNVGIYEFDVLNRQINYAKLKITNLIDDIKMAEQKRSMEQISKLRAQINPHFVLNTLNTLHWSAMVKGEKQISEITMDLTKILAYNLRDDKNTTTLEQDIEIVEHYLRLQQNRIYFTYRKENHCGEEVWDCKIPRFIMQPLVENSLLHSKCENLEISIVIDLDGQDLMLSVVDNGGGIPIDKLEELNHNENSGIGMAFVRTAMQEYYGEKELVKIYNNTQGGTTITLRLLQHLEG